MVRSRTSPRSTNCWTHPVAGPRTGRDPSAPRSSRRACRRIRAAAVTALDRLAVPGWMHPRPSGRRPEPITAREQSVLEGVLDLLTGLLQVALGLVALALGLQLLVIGGPAEPLFGLPLDLLGLVLGLVINTHGPRLLVEWSPPASLHQDHQPAAG